MATTFPNGVAAPSPGDPIPGNGADAWGLVASTADTAIGGLRDRLEPELLSETSPIDSLPPKNYIVSNVNIARALNLPWEYPCSIIVASISIGSGVTYTALTAERPPRMFIKSRLNNGVSSDWAEVAMAPDVAGVWDSSGEVRREQLQQKLRARKGGTIGTAGRGVIALRFDDAPTEFVDKILPLLRERDLPFTRVTTSDSIASQSVTITDAMLTDMQAYSIADGGEVWNHGRDHADASGNANIYDNLIGALGKLRAKMPRIPVDCFAPPGGAVSYGGHMPSNAVSNWSDTATGRLLTAHHAIASGYFHDSYYRPIDGVLRDGQIHYSVDAYTATRAKELIDRARDWKVGVCMMWHANNLDSGSNMTTAGLVETLDYLAAQRDAGNILVLTKSGMGVADVRSDQRENILTSTGGTTFSESVTYPQYRQSIWGSTRELLATVAGTSGQVVTSVVGESTKTHTIPSTGVLALRHVATIPNDITSLTVSIDAVTTGAQLLAV